MNLTDIEHINCIPRYISFDRICILLSYFMSVTSEYLRQLELLLKALPVLT